MVVLAAPRRVRALLAALAVAGLGLAASGAIAGCAPPAEPSPEQVALFAQPVDVEVVIRSARNALRYEDTRVEAPAGATVRIVMDNTATTSPAMVHNVVVVRSPDAVERVGRAAAREADNIPADPAILFHTPLTGPGERTAVVVTMPPPGEYPYLCTFPGHWSSMQGVLVSTP